MLPLSSFNGVSAGASFPAPISPPSREDNIMGSLGALPALGIWQGLTQPTHLKRAQKPSTLE